jgi:imidazolonepropionase-like amidohydrolase
MKILLTNGHVWDGEADARYRADILVSGNRIEAIAKGSGELPRNGATVVDASGATVIPGLIDAHTHLWFFPTSYLTQFDDTPPEETLMVTVHNAKLMLDHGFTGCVGAGSPRIRTEVVVRNEIDAGRIPGPRLLASTPTLTATGALNDTRQLHQERVPLAMVADGPEEIRKAVRLGYRESVDIVKLNVSGDNLIPRPWGKVTSYSEEEVAMAVKTAHALGLRVATHSRSTESIKICLRQGVDIIHHADFADAEGLDMFAAAKHRVLVGPSIGYLHFMLYESEGFLTREALSYMEVEDHMACNIATHTELRKRGLKAVIGGDYGLAWQPQGRNAFDIEALVKYLGYTPIEALRCATRNGGEAMGRSHELGLLKPGYLADLLMVDGDPTADVRLLQDTTKLLGIMKDGKFHKTPATAR